jgi:hypothetical protein
VMTNPTTEFAALLQRAKQYDMPHVKVPMALAEQVLTALHTTASALGKRGGAARSPQKTASSRKNGLKGGRPLRRCAHGLQPSRCRDCRRRHA